MEQPQPLPLPLPTDPLLPEPLLLVLLLVGVVVDGPATKSMPMPMPMQMSTFFMPIQQLAMFQTPPVSEEYCRNILFSTLPMVSYAKNPESSGVKAEDDRPRNTMLFHQF
jgi:hypothetical protein